MYMDHLEPSVGAEEIQTGSGKILFLFCARLFHTQTDFRPERLGWEKSKG
jgi:hypothetical protein